MPESNLTITNIVGGEISPNMYGRVDLAAYKKGLKRMRNFICLAQGGGRYRNGTFLVNYTRQNKLPRLIPFQFNDSQAYVIEVTEGKMRFFKDNSAITEVPFSIAQVTSDNPGVINCPAHNYANDDTVFLTGLVGPKRLNDRFYVVKNSTTVSKNITGITKANPAVVTSAAHGFANGDIVYISGVVGMTQVNGNMYKVAGAAANTFQLQTLAGANVDSTGYSVYTSGGKVQKGSFTLQDVFGNDISTAELPDWVSGGTVARIYEIDSPYLEEELDQIQFAQNADTMYLTHANWRPRRLTRAGHTNWQLTTPVFKGNPFGATPKDGDGKQPVAVGFTDTGRLLFGLNETMYASAAPTANTGTQFENFVTGAKPTDAVIFTLAPINGKIDAIQWIASTGKLVAVGTYGGVRLIYGATQTEAFTPIAVTAKAINGYGCAKTLPVSSGSSIYYIQRGSRVMRNLEYDFTQDWYQTVDRNLISEHLTVSGYRGITIQEGLFDIIWGVKNDGQLIGMTFQEKEDIYGWHQHYIGGKSKDSSGLILPRAKVVSLATMARDSAIGDQIWMGVERYINGQTVRTVEYMADPIEFYQRHDFDSFDPDLEEDDQKKFENAIYEQQKESLHLDMATALDSVSSLAQLSLTTVSVSNTGGIPAYGLMNAGDNAAVVMFDSLGNSTIKTLAATAGRAMKAGLAVDTKNNLAYLVEHDKASFAAYIRTLKLDGTADTSPFSVPVALTGYNVGPVGGIYHHQVMTISEDGKYLFVFVFEADDLHARILKIDTTSGAVVATSGQINNTRAAANTNNGVRLILAPDDRFLMFMSKTNTYVADTTNLVFVYQAADLAGGAENVGCALSDDGTVMASHDIGANRIDKRALSLPSTVTPTNFVVPAAQVSTTNNCAAIAFPKNDNANVLIWGCIVANGTKRYINKINLASGLLVQSYEVPLTRAVDPTGNVDCRWFIVDPVSGLVYGYADHTSAPSLFVYNLDAQQVVKEIPIALAYGDMDDIQVNRVA